MKIFEFSAEKSILSVTEHIDLTLFPDEIKNAYYS